MKSIEASLVGTMEYIAPELITTEKYSCSVDYWSLGIIGFEVVTGTRPFAPHLALAQWMLRVRDKKSEHIAIIEDDGGNIVYSNQIFAENHVSQAFKRLLEEWLRLALEWNPKQRGHQFESPNANEKSVTFVENDSSVTTSTATAQAQAPIHVLKFFSKVDEILSIKILTIFVLTTHKTISMEVTSDTTIDALYAFIEQETNIPKKKCHFIMALENFSTDIDNMNGQHKPIDFYFVGYFDKPMIYVIPIGDADSVKCNADTDETTSIIVDVPLSVRNVLMNHEQKLKVHSLRKFACDTLHFVRRENKNYKICLVGWFNYALQLNHEIELCQKDVHKMKNLIYGLNGATELYGQTIIENKQKIEKKVSQFLVFCARPSTNQFHSLPHISVHNQNRIRSPFGWISTKNSHKMLKNWSKRVRKLLFVINRHIDVVVMPTKVTFCGAHKITLILRMRQKHLMPSVYKL